MLLYQLLSIILAPIIDIYLIVRKLGKKEDEKRFPERLGYPSKERSNGQLIWVHCASVGESNSILPLIDYLLKKHPKINILFTSGTITSAQILKTKLPKRVIHQFVPIDKIITVRRFLKHWQPDLAIFVESEIWPNLIHQTKKSGCKLALLNARISQKSYNIWKLLHVINFNILKYFDIIFAQSRQDQIRFKKLGIKRADFTGNLKSIQPIAKINQVAFNSLEKQIGNRKFWLAASTHKGEEWLIIKTHQELKEKHPDLLTIIAPRHPKRVRELKDLIPLELNYKIRSKNEKITADTDLYIADTLGELTLFYKLAQISFIGGSLTENIGGHNPYEAIKLDCFPISGPYIENFKEAYEELEKNNSSIIVANQSELCSQIHSLLQKPKTLESLLENSSKSNDKTNEILEKINLELSKLLN